ncbi:sigma-70 family RNA polymerase sigma factor [Clostridium saudiense]|uniref:sigma-70 family RNA polymerase sigma factor n=1 Tax=Clostridium saudiense TaxID=1414720 RepID=UPI0018AA36AB|nr:sigma-70 family RNA polymerase sigma factor [Clostridium saudiense]
MSFNNLFQSGVLELIKVIRNYDFNDKKKNMSNEELVKLYQDGDKSALDELIQANTGIISKIANRYNGINRELEFDDLFQNGVIGFIKAVEKYNPNHEKKAKFITYAVFYIDRYIYGCVNGWSSKDTGNNELYNSCTSLNIPIGEDETEEIIDFIEGVDYGFENIEENIFLSNLRDELEKVMQEHNTLEQREVLKYRYGWNIEPMTLNDIADIFNITGNKVRNIESMALRKIRNSSWAKEHIKEFAELGYIDSFYLDVFRSWGIDV